MELLLTQIINRSSATESWLERAFLATVKSMSIYEHTAWNATNLSAPTEFERCGILGVEDRVHDHNWGNDISVIKIRQDIAKKGGGRVAKPPTERCRPLAQTIASSTRPHDLRRSEEIPSQELSLDSGRVTDFSTIASGAMLIG